MKCPRCPQENPAEAKFCLECGTPLRVTVTPAGSYADPHAEIKRLRRTLGEALEQQAATAKILQVIAGGPTDPQPVFDTIVENATQLCGAARGSLFLFDGEAFRAASMRGPTPATLEYHSGRAIRPGPNSALGRIIQERRPVHIHDLMDDPAYREGDPLRRAVVDLEGMRTLVMVPLLKGERLVGAIGAHRREVHPFSDAQIALLRTFADQAVIAIENVRLFTELQEKNQALTEAHGQVIEALEQQTATSEILSVISSSPTDIQPVFDTIVKSVARLCDGMFASLHRFDGDLLHWVAQHNYTADGLEAMRKRYPMRAGRDTASGRAVIDRTVIHIRDFESDPDAPPSSREIARAFGYRSLITVPMLRESQPVGAIAVARRSGPFSAAQIALLQTFADQAVIAIENVRLFTELQQKNRALTESLEQQTATSEILRVISSSPTDLQPVLDAVAQSAARLCNANDALIYRLEGDRLELVAKFGPIPSATGSLPLTRGLVTGRAVIDRQTLHIEDIATQLDEFPDAEIYVRRFNHHTLLITPLLREGVALGVIAIRRTQVQPFSVSQIDLLKTFADQAVIAIENVRLFKELEEKNKALTTANAQVTEALEQRTAPSDILRVIAGSPTDVQPVFEAIAATAARLCDATFSAVVRFDGGLLHLVAMNNMTPEEIEAYRRLFPRLPGRHFIMGRAFLDGRTVHVDDVLTDPDYDPHTLEVLQRAAVYRTCVGIPILRDGVSIGVIGCSRREVKPFTATQIELVKTFADQAVIAIENARLFAQLETRNGELTQALDRQTATAEILRVIGTSPTDPEPVFEAIARSAVRVCGALSCGVFVVDQSMVCLAATHGVPAQRLERFRSEFPAPLTSRHDAVRAIRECSLFHMADIENNPEASPEQVEFARLGGYRTRLMVPMSRGDVALGLIAVTGAAPTPFSERQVELLRTFADQAVIAIENVRLFTELQTRNRQLTEALDQQTATGQILRVISSSPTDIQPVFDCIAESAVRLCRGMYAGVVRVDGEFIDLAAHDNFAPEALALYTRSYPQRLSRENPTAHAILDRKIVEVPDIDQETGYSAAARERAHALGYRAIVVVPMLHGDLPIGAIGVSRREPGLFPADHIQLLKTFADQAVIAIENVRLFTELQEKNRALMQAHAQVTEALEQQTATSEILRVISAVHTDAQPVFDTIVQSAVRLCKAAGAAVFLTDGRMLYEPANYGGSSEVLAASRARYPRPLDMDTTAGIAVLTRSVVHVPDTEDPSAIEWMRQSGRLVGFRSVVTVPMLREGDAVGAILVTRRQPDPFSDTEVELLKTFTDQAVIAIENVRLFRELQARTGELTRSVGELKALGEVGQAISSTLDLQTVLRTIVARATELAGVDAGVIYEYDEQDEVFVPRATERLEAEIVETLIAAPVRRGEGVTGRLADAQEPIQLSDILEAPAESRIRDTLGRAGYRALLALPLVRDDHLLGGLTVFRKTPGEFSPDVIELLRTFATQSALAIQNARLFHEIEDKSRQLQAASQHKSEFLANMSHELRTPLNAIIGFSEVLSERLFGELNAKQEEYLKDIHASGQHLLSLINDILDLSKIEAGRMELDLGTFDLPNVIDTAVLLIRERAGRRGIEVRVAVDDGIGEIQGDERKLKQVLLNLLSNAIKFTPEGGRIEVRAKQVDGSVEIAVSDTGVGIAPEDQEAIFEEFRQVGTADKKVEGTGLGLALSRKLVELHGGRIWVESQIGVGSTFTFTIPIRTGG